MTRARVGPAGQGAWWRLLAAIVLVLIALTRSARADEELPSPANADAKEQIEAGNKAFLAAQSRTDPEVQRRDFEEAILHYKAGAKLETKNAFTFYWNLGHAYRQLGSYTQADWFYRAFLEAGPTSGLSPSAALVAPHPTPSTGAPETPPPSPATVSVAILTEPVGAAVFVDDELVGTAPTKANLVPGRSVRVRAELPGNTPTEQTHVVADHPETLHLTLAPVPITARTPPAAPGTRTGTGLRAADHGQRPAGGSADATKPFDPERLGQ